MAKKPTFIGLDTSYPIASGKSLVRLHLDSAASPLASAKATDTINTLLPHYSNSHSYVHNSAQISTEALNWAHDTILACLGANPEHYTAIFTGSGTTAGINRIARGLAAVRADKKVVLVSAMEHHANDLPHRQFDNRVIYFPVVGEGAESGSVDVQAFAALCEKHRDDINYVAVSAVSNVTGIRNPISTLANIAHQSGALLLVDGAQSVAHGPSDVDASGADFFVFSGHKVYTPMSPGVVIAKKTLLHDLPGQDLGGGSVNTVSYYDYELMNDFPDKEQSGTPNIAGAVALASVISQLACYGFDQIASHDQTLMNALIKGLAEIDALTVYGDPNLPRTGAVSFNHTAIDHGLLAAILNDYYAIAVRNECFCAQPYVSDLIKEALWELDLSEIAEAQQESYIKRKRGMVRASIALYNTLDDINRLIAALKEIDTKIDSMRSHYQAHDDGSYSHKTFKIDWRQQLKL